MTQKPPLPHNGSDILHGRVNVWDHLAHALQTPETLPANGGLWGEIKPLPTGLWQAARDETLLLARQRNSLWTAANDETLIIRPRVNIWEAPLPLATKRSQDLWETVDGETLIIKRDAPTLWAKPAVRNFAKYKPQRATGWALKELQTANGEPYWVLKHLTRQSYLRLDEQQVFLWNMLDGSHTVQDLAVEHFVKFAVFNVEWLTGFLGQLEQKGFLLEQKADVYVTANKQTLRRTVQFKLWQILGLIFQSEIGFPVDGFYAALYRVVGWIAYTRVVQVLFFLVAVLGLPAFFLIARTHTVLETASGNNAWFSLDVLGLIAAEVITLFVHESAHALTTQHYGRHVRRGGVGLYFGMIAFFMDTTDIWMEPRGPRLAVTWAGPYSGFILGGACCLLLLAFPAISGAQLIYQVAAWCYLVSISNLNPLLKFDGYYILMDWLEIPMLRERSINFVRQTLWDKLKARQKFSREDIIFTIFGIAAILYTGLMVIFIFQAYGAPLIDFVRSLLKI